MICEQQNGLPISSRLATLKNQERWYSKQASLAVLLVHAVYQQIEGQYVNDNELAILEASELEGT